MIKNYVQIISESNSKDLWELKCEDDGEIYLYDGYEEIIWFKDIVEMGWSIKPIKSEIKVQP